MRQRIRVAVIVRNVTFFIKCLDFNYLFLSFVPVIKTFYL